MAANTSGPRRRSRKSRPGAPRRSNAPGGAGTPPGGAGIPSADAGTPLGGAGTPPGGAGTPPRARRQSAPAYRNFEERPPAPWHPLPLSELLILAGAIAFVVAMLRLQHGIAAGAPLLVAGVVAVGLGTAEVSWREHRSGFRSHTLLLAFVPVLTLHSAVVLGYSALASPSRALNIGMFVVDVAVFYALARYLRARFQEARTRR